jgi:hypothetical protein
MFWFVVFGSFLGADVAQMSIRPVTAALPKT